MRLTCREPPCRGKNDCAVSEVIGAVMLISIVIIGVAIIGVVLWSQPPSQKIPVLSMGIANESCKVILTHKGGDILERGSFKIYVDTFDNTTSFVKTGGPGPATTWEMGDTLVYDPSPPCTQPPKNVLIVYTGGNGAIVLSSASFESSPLPPQVYVPPPQHTITATAATGGSISPSGAVNVIDGTDQTFSISPGFGYHVSDVTVDGVSQGAITSYMFTAVETDHTISATFAITTYNILASATTGGTIAPSGTVTVNEGANQTFTIAPISPYLIADVVVNGISAGKVSSYMFVNVTANSTINATFALLPVANFTGSPRTGTEPLAVSFTDTSNGSPTSWMWTFGDIGAGNTSTLQNPSHTYTTRGSYSVNLTVNNIVGSNTSIKTTYINVTPTPPWYCGWSFRKNITIDKSQVSGSLTDFPVLINLISDSDLSAHALSNGYDILFTSSDGTTKLPHEIEGYTSGSGALVAWVKVPTVTSLANTTIYLYYGNAASTDQQDRINVWTASFQSVWHLNETTGGTNAIKDATLTANDGTDRNSPTLGAAGKFGNAVTLDGINDYISTKTQYVNPQTFSVSLWFKTTNAVSRKIFGFEDRQTGTGSVNWDRHIYIGTGGYLLDGVYDGNTRIVMTGSTKNDGNWHHAVMTHASNTLKLYVDGSFIGQIATSGAEATTGYWRMGSYKLNSWPQSTGDGYFQGTIDEVELSSVERTQSWITTEYNNRNSPATFHYLQNQEEWTC